MTKTSGEIEKEFIDGLKTTTGKDLKQWLQEIKGSGIEKRNDIIKWLKENKDFGHMNASLLVGIYLNGGNAVYGNENELLENQFVKCPEMKPVYEKLVMFIQKNFPATQIIPKKTYISFTAKKEFAAINVKPNELRLGLDLGDVPYTDNLQKSKLTGPMPRISHMIILKDENNINEKLRNEIEKSYARTN